MILGLTETEGSAIHLELGPVTGGSGVSSQGPPPPVKLNAAVMPFPPRGNLSVLNAQSTQGPMEARLGSTCAEAKPSLVFELTRKFGIDDRVPGIVDDGRTGGSSALLA